MAARTPSRSPAASRSSTSASGSGSSVPASATGPDAPASVVIAAAGAARSTDSSAPNHRSKAAITSAAVQNDEWSTPRAAGSTTRSAIGNPVAPFHW